MRNVTHAFVLTVLFSSFCFPAAVLADDATADIPVRRVVMFSSGVGFFEHTGQVEGDAAAKLMFKTEQINDILKSMVVMDPSGSGATVHYASRDPLTRALQSFAVDLSGNPDLAGILMQIRGAKVTVFSPDKIIGTILGLETKTRKVNTPGDTTILQETYLNLVADKGIQSIPVATIQNLKIQDESLRKEIEKAMKLILASSDKQRKAVEVRFAGKGKRPVRIGYVTETPVWKVSYRLELSGDKPFLQGWAIVENTSDQDWSDVQLSLISGRPISFVQELYTPLYLPRPVVQPKLYASLRPREYEEGMDKAKREFKQSGSGIAGGRRMSSHAIGKPVAPPAPALAAAETALYEDAPARGSVKLDTVQAAASGGKVGELFSFTIKDPVSLPRRQSAMLPIVSGPIEAKKVSIYNQSVMPKHPLNGAWITNTTGMKMLAGPVTVFDEKMYAGDAQLGNLSQKDKRLISYALDLDMTVDPSQKTQSSLVAAKIVKGVMTLTYKQLYNQKYEIKNKTKKDRTLIIEQPFYARRKLIAPKKYAEKTPNLYRFELAIKPGETETFNVSEEEIRYQSVSLIQQNDQSLLYWSKTAQLSPAAREALQQAAMMKQRLAEAERKLDQLRKEKSAIESGQGRLRQGISTVGRDSSMGKRYIQKLSQQEDQIESLEKNIKEAQALMETLRNELSAFIEKMNF
ncbi:MAG: DUF4139 domain-containing protein [Phycisphaerae bacterium]|nr:DUF4139 domain-containing protein [Phycisphaerae bacterium]